MNAALKLTFDLLPRSQFGVNLRNDKATWDVMRKYCYKQAGYVCEVCGKQCQPGERMSYSPEHRSKPAYGAHEIFDEDGNLTRIMFLCIRCHDCKHIGRARLERIDDYLIDHYAKVSEVTKQIAEQHFCDRWNQWMIDEGLRPPGWKGDSREQGFKREPIKPPPFKSPPFWDGKQWSYTRPTT